MTDPYIESITVLSDIQPLYSEGLQVYHDGTREQTASSIWVPPPRNNTSKQVAVHSNSDICQHYLFPGHIAGRCGLNYVSSSHKHTLRAHMATYQNASTEDILLIYIGDTNNCNWKRLYIHNRL